MTRCTLALLAVALFPASLEARQWTDNTGQFHREAEYLYQQDGQVWLRAPDGKLLVVSPARLIALIGSTLPTFRARIPPESPWPPPSRRPNCRRRQCALQARHPAAELDQQRLGRAADRLALPRWSLLCHRVLPPSRAAAASRSVNEHQAHLPRLLWHVPPSPARGRQAQRHRCLQVPGGQLCGGVSGDADFQWDHSWIQRLCRRPARTNRDHELVLRGGRAGAVELSGVLLCAVEWRGALRVRPPAKPVMIQPLRPGWARTARPVRPPGSRAGDS